MALDQRAVSVGTAATRIDTADETDASHGSAVSVYNNGSATVYLGASDVTTTTGYPLASGEHLAVDLGPTTEGLYGIVASGTVEVRVLETGV